MLETDEKKKEELEMDMMIGVATAGFGTVGLKAAKASKEALASYATVQGTHLSVFSGVKTAVQKVPSSKKNTWSRSHSNVKKNKGSYKCFKNPTTSPVKHKPKPKQPRGPFTSLTQTTIGGFVL